MPRTAKPPQTAVAPPTICFCPTCMGKMRVPANIPAGKKVRCPKCNQTFDPNIASSRGTDKTQLRRNQEADGDGMPEWVWSIIIGGGVGVAIGLVSEFVNGIIDASVSDMFGGSFAGGMVTGMIRGLLFFTVLGAIMGLGTSLGGSPFVGYGIAVFALFPALLLVGAIGGSVMVLPMAIITMQLLDNYLYS